LSSPELGSSVIGAAAERVEQTLSFAIEKIAQSKINHFHRAICSNQNVLHLQTRKEKKVGKAQHNRKKISSDPFGKNIFKNGCYIFLPSLQIAMRNSHPVHVIGGSNKLSHDGPCFLL
jgi:hypothetical protein